MKDNQGNLIKEIKRSRAQAEFMRNNLNGVEIVELPKEKRERKVSEVAEIVDEVKPTPKAEPKKSDAENVKKDVSNMGKIELTAYIKTLTDLEQLKELTNHELKSIRELAEKKIKELA